MRSGDPTRGRLLAIVAVVDAVALSVNAGGGGLAFDQAVGVFGRVRRAGAALSLVSGAGSSLVREHWPGPAASLNAILRLVGQSSP